jgi:cytochrome c oxidase accessory protein FixG
LFETKLLGLRKRIANKQVEPDWSKPSNQAKRLVAILLWSVLAFVAAADFIWYFVPPEDFFKYLQNPGEHGVMIGLLVGVALFLIADIVFIKENFCVYICPYARVQSVMYDDDTFQTVYDYKRGGYIYKEDPQLRHIEKNVHNKKELVEFNDENAECTLCESCVKVCPTHIDIRKGMQLECINCLECADACTKVMGALGKPSLVRWTSYYALDSGTKTRVFRFRVVAYMIALSIVDFIMFKESSKTITNFKLLEKEEFIDYSDDIELIFIELPKFKKKLSELNSIQEKFIYFIKNTQNLEYIPKELEDISDALEVINEASLTKEELELQHKRKEFIFVQKSSIELAKEQGLEQGRQSEKLEIAKNLLNANVDLETIKLSTGLSDAELVNLTM